MKRKLITKQQLGGVVFIGITIGFVLLLSYMTPKSNKPLEGIPHNYYHPDVWDKDTVSDEYEKMWITGQGDTIWE